MRGSPTDSERVLWTHLRKRRLGGFRFRRQHPVGGFIVDFACPQLSFAIELDGSQHDEGRSKDDWRSEKLAEEGYRVLRVWNNEVLGNLDGVSDVIYAAVEEGEKALGVGLDCLHGTGPLCPSDISPASGGNPSALGIPRCRFAPAPPFVARKGPGPLCPHRSPSP